MFPIFVSDLPAFEHSLNLWLYADDDVKQVDLAASVNDSWSRENKLPLCHLSANCLHLGAGSRKQNLHSSVIPITSWPIHLGITHTSDPFYDEHITLVAKRRHHVDGMLSRTYSSRLAVE